MATEPAHGMECQCSKCCPEMFEDGKSVVTRDYGGAFANWTEADVAKEVAPWPTAPQVYDPVRDATHVQRLQAVYDAAREYVADYYKHETRTTDEIRACFGQHPHVQTFLSLALKDAVDKATGR